jgi:hypothetical protein
MDSRTGRLLRAFRSGFGTFSSGYGGHAKFLDDDRCVVASTTYSGSSHHALRLIDLRTGEVLKELGYSRHNAQAWFAVAAHAHTIAALIFSWKWGIGTDLDEPFRRGVDWLALFHPDQAEPFYVRPKVPLFGEARSPKLRSTLRISPDGRLVAVGEGRAIQVYDTEPSAKP